MDPPGPTFRHEKFADYKANRAEMPADLVPQIPLVRRLLEVMGHSVPGDAGLRGRRRARHARRPGRWPPGATCTIATSDKDARQLLWTAVRLLNLRTNALLGADELARRVGHPARSGRRLPLARRRLGRQRARRAGDRPEDRLGTAPQRTARSTSCSRNADAVAGAKRQENLAAHADTARAGRELIRLDDRGAASRSRGTAAGCHAARRASRSPTSSGAGVPEPAGHGQAAGGCGGEPPAAARAARRPRQRTLFDLRQGDAEAAPAAAVSAAGRRA